MKNSILIHYLAYVCCPLVEGFLLPPTITSPSTASRTMILFADILHKSSSVASVDGASQEIMLTLFNEQITNEFAASHLYLSASIWFESRDWEGMAAYMLAESSDERQHALSLIDFANKRNMNIQLQSFPQPTSNWDSPEQVWGDILSLERDNTRSLLQLAQAANACQDFAMLAFLNPFHMEQVDAEAKIGTILAKVKDEQKTPGLLRQLDHELGQEASSGA
jgi:ferritin